MPHHLLKCLFTALCFGLFTSYGQIISKEDSLNAGLVPRNSNTVISGYGEALVGYDLRLRTGEADLRRNVLFFGHKFSDKISFFSEMELEHASVAFGDEEGGNKGELAMEQLFLKFNLNKHQYLTAGLFIPRIGIINENHLPTTYNGNDRHFTEQLIIPSTWREIGIGLYGNSRKVPGLNYSIAVINGLSSARFTSGTGISDGRGSGSRASASNLAVTGSVLMYLGKWRLQSSAYIGGSAGLTKREADSLQLSYGAFGTPVALAEINAQYHNSIISFKALAGVVQIPEAYSINRAYANNTPETMMGSFAEIGYNLFHIFHRHKEKNLLLFARYEWMDLNYKTASNGIYNDLFRKQYIVSGLTFQPIRGIVIKADYVHRLTGEPNPALLITPFPQPLPYYTSQGFFNLGLGYSF